MSTWYPKEETENERRANAETLQRKIDIAQLHNRAANLGFTPGSEFETPSQESASGAPGEQEKPCWTCLWGCKRKAHEGPCTEATQSEATETDAKETETKETDRSKAFESVPKTKENRGKAPCAVCGVFVTIRDMLHSHRQRHMYYSSAAEEMRYGKLCIHCTFRTCRDEAIGAGDPSLAPSLEDIEKEVNDIKFKRQGVRMDKFHEAINKTSTRSARQTAKTTSSTTGRPTRRRCGAPRRSTPSLVSTSSAASKKPTSSGPSATSPKR